MKTPNKELVANYKKICRAMATLRASECVVLYIKLEKQRGEVHDMILKDAGVTRNDFEFAQQLAAEVEEYLDDVLAA